MMNWLTFLFLNVIHISLYLVLGIFWQFRIQEELWQCIGIITGHIKIMLNNFVKECKMNPKFRLVKNFYLSFVTEY